MISMRTFVAALLALVVFPLVSQADPIDVAGSTGSWQAMPSPIGPTGSPFWNNYPTDGGSTNVGFYLTGTAGIAASDLNYWGSGVTADSKTNFSTLFGVDAVLKLELAGYASSNKLYYYDSTGTYLLFDGAAGAGASITFAPVGTFGLMIVSPDGTFRSDASLYGAGSDDSFEHFAVFKQLSNGTLWVGVEDLKYGGDKDYNDMVFSLSAVPEPASMVILGIGGLIVGGAALRRRQRAVQG